MKRLKVCALALGMMLAGSVVAMDPDQDRELDLEMYQDSEGRIPVELLDGARNQVKKLYDGILAKVEFLAPARRKSFFNDFFSHRFVNLVSDKSLVAPLVAPNENTKKEVKNLLVAYHDQLSLYKRDIALNKASMVARVVFPTIYFIEINQKPIVLALIAGVSVGLVVAYKKFTAKKKIEDVEETETEDEEIKVTAE